MCLDSLPPGERPARSPLAGDQPRHLPMFAVDIASFGARDPDIQLYVRDALYRMVRAACDAGGVPWARCHREDRGDGILVLAPAGTSETALLDSLVTHLRTGIRTHNKAARPAAHIRLRVAVTAGYVTGDAYGVAGRTVIQLFRMLDSPALKTLFSEHGGDFVLIVSPTLYQEVITYGRGMIDPESFLAIDLDLKETHDRGWVWLPARPGAAAPLHDHRSRPTRATGAARGRPGSPHGLRR
jgi:hypothetical protein